MNQYEVTFIVDPVLSGDEIKATAQTYVDALQSNEANIVHVDEMGLRQLAYPINNRTSGVYYCIEYQMPNGTFNEKLELALRRDERIMRFLTYRLDKYGIKYNEDKRNGLIGKVKKKNKGKDKDTKDEKKKSTANKSASKPDKDSVKASPVKADALKTQASVSLAKNAVAEVAGEEE